MAVLELIPVNDRKGMGAAGVMSAVISIVEVIVDEDTGVVIPAERAPAAVILTPIPMHPGRAPGIMGDPVPAQAEPPAPAAVMINRPAPGLIRNPGPAALRIPIPVAVVIGPPIVIGIDVGNPDIAVGSLIGPRAVVSQFALVVIELRRQIALGNVLGLDGIPVFVPVVEIVLSIREVRLGPKLTVRGHKSLPAADELGAGLAGRFHRAFEDRELGLSIASGVEAIQAFFQDVERGIGSMDFKTLLFLEQADPEVDISAQQMEPDPVVTAPRQVGEFNEGAVIDTEIVLPSETDLRPAALGFDLVSLDYGHVGHARFRSEVAGPLDDDIALDIGQPDKAPAVVILVLGESEERQKSQDRDQ